MKNRIIYLVLIAAALVLTLCLVLSACMGGGTESGASSQNEATSESASSEAESSQTVSSENGSSADISSDVVGSQADSSEAEPSQTESSASSQDESNRFASVTGYNPELLARYTSYAKKHSSLSAESAVSLVNLGFDAEFYSDIRPSQGKHTVSVIVNKFFTLGEDYVPEDLVALGTGYASVNNVLLCREARDAFIEMADAAKEAGVRILGQSGYRSYETQEILYNRYLKQENGNVAAVDSYSARPGHSEHQTGLAIDVVDGKAGMYSYGTTASYRWAKDNSWRFGYIIHYTEANRFITGYDCEEWHFRYVGTEAAKTIYETGITIDEYLMKALGA